MNANLKLYVATTRNHVPPDAYKVLGDNPWAARALVVAAHKGLAMRAAENAGITVSLNGWRVATPESPYYASDVDAMLRVRGLLYAPKPGDVLLSRRHSSGFVARWNPTVRRWIRVAVFPNGGGTPEVMPGAVNETLHDRDGDPWEILAEAQVARCVSVPSESGVWIPLSNLQANHGPLRRLP